MEIRADCREKTLEARFYLTLMLWYINLPPLKRLYVTVYVIQRVTTYIQGKGTK
jgi:hypothetical protein